MRYYPHCISFFIPVPLYITNFIQFKSMSVCGDGGDIVFSSLLSPFSFFFSFLRGTWDSARLIEDGNHTRAGSNCFSLMYFELTGFPWF